VGRLCAGADRAGIRLEIGSAALAGIDSDGCCDRQGLPVRSVVPVELLPDRFVLRTGARIAGCFVFLSENGPHGGAESVRSQVNRRAARAWAAMGMLLVLAATLAAAPLPSAWSHWRYWRPIEVPSTDSVRLTGLVLPQDLYLHAQTALPDLRIIDDTGNEVPYAHYLRQGSASLRDLPTEVLENSYAPGDYTQVVLRVGASALF